MAQGEVKKASKSSSSKNKKPTSSGPKRGSRVIAPKKQKLIAQNKVMKKHTAGRTALTEKKLAERAGHLEILAGGKKEKKRKDDEKK